MATAERDYYEILGVDREAPDADIKRAFRKLARELHPDVSEAPDAEERFREAAEAYEVLSDPERRATYNRYGREGLRGGGFAPADFDLGNLSDIFGAFFGESLFGQAAHPGGPSRGGDVTASAEITLTEAFTGVTENVSTRVASTCETCDGNGAAPGTSPRICDVCGGAGRVQQVSQSVFGQFVRTGACPSCEGIGSVVETPCETCDGVGRTLHDREIDIDVPAGIEDGQRIRVRNEGHAGALGGPNGDLFLQVRVTPLPGLERDGADLHTAVELTMTEAALGTALMVPGPVGEIEVEVPAGTQPGHVIVLRGQGMPSLEGRRRGAFHAHVRVHIPRRLDDEQRTLVDQLGEALGEEAYQDDGDNGEDGGFFGRIKNAFR
ncbi:J domain-containing protein [Gaiella sp.]|uniref:J domain-containing protein n=1 Tax=Gaiella sp. TaxID=2663207 RepID=UPI00326517E7